MKFYSPIPIIILTADSQIVPSLQTSIGTLLAPDQVGHGSARGNDGGNRW